MTGHLVFVACPPQYVVISLYLNQRVSNHCMLFLDLFHLGPDRLHTAEDRVQELLAMLFIVLFFGFGQYVWYVQRPSGQRFLHILLYLQGTSYLLGQGFSAYFVLKFALQRGKGEKREGV